MIRKLGTFVLPWYFVVNDTSSNKRSIAAFFAFQFVVRLILESCATKVVEILAQNTYPRLKIAFFSSGRAIE